VCYKASQHSVCVQHNGAGRAVASAHSQLEPRPQFVVLRHGSRLQVRPVLPTDEHADKELRLSAAGGHRIVFHCRACMW